MEIFNGMTVKTTKKSFQADVAEKLRSARRRCDCGGTRAPCDQQLWNDLKAGRIPVAGIPEKIDVYCLTCHRLDYIYLKS